MRFRLVREFPAEGFHVAVTCRALKVSMSGFSEWCRRDPSARNVDDAVLLNPIIDIQPQLSGTRRIGECGDSGSTFEPAWQITPTANLVEAIEPVEFALAEVEVLLERPIDRDCPVDVEVGEMLPVVTLVTDNGGPFRASRFETLISQHLEPRHVRIWVKSLGHFLTRDTQVDIQPQASSLSLPVEGGERLFDHRELVDCGDGDQAGTGMGAVPSEGTKVSMPLWGAKPAGSRSRTSPRRFSCLGRSQPDASQ